MKISRCVCGVVIPFLCGFVAADTELQVPAGVAANVTVEVSAGIPIFGTASATDSTAVVVAASAMRVQPSSNSSPFSDFDLNDHFIQTNGGSLVFSLCWPVVGCLETLSVSVNLLDVELVGNRNVLCDADGNWFINDATYNMDLAIQYSGTLIGESELITEQSSQVGVSGALYAEGSMLYVDNLDIGTVVIDVPDESLPDALTGLSIEVTPDFTSLVYSGEFISADLDGDGCVGGADLTILLGGWGSSGSADLDGSGNVDGADLTVLLSNWGCG